MIETYVANVLCLKDKNIFLDLYSKVPLERKQKIDSYKFQKDKILSLGSWQLFYSVLKNKGINLNDINICYKENHKPYIFPDINLCFNLSHSGEYAICSISKKEVGCDIEKISNINMGFAKRFFTQAEYDFLAAEENEAERKKKFYRLWTLKESFMKITGYGAKLPLKAFNVKIEKEISVTHNLNLKNEFYFKEYYIEDEYCCSCCGLENDFSSLKIIKIDA